MGPPGFGPGILARSRSSGSPCESDAITRLDHGPARPSAHPIFGFQPATWAGSDCREAMKSLKPNLVLLRIQTEPMVVMRLVNIIT